MSVFYQNFDICFLSELWYIHHFFFLLFKSISGIGRKIYVPYISYINSMNWHWLTFTIDKMWRVMWETENISLLIQVFIKHQYSIEKHSMATLYFCIFHRSEKDHMLTSFSFWPPTGESFVVSDHLFSQAPWFR